MRLTVWVVRHEHVDQIFDDSLFFAVHRLTFAGLHDESTAMPFKTTIS